MAQVITIAGERLFALKAQNNEQLDIDTFIFANVPGQDPNATIDRNESVPPVGQQVHQQIVQQVGRVNDNVVIYSTVLDSLTGPFDFNWVGLYSSVNQTLIAVSHIPNVSKTITVPGSAGNTLNRNFGIEYSGIADLTGISVAPETWQLDYTSRLNGMDELTRQLAADMNGKDWFIDDGFKVVPRSTLNSFKVTAGAGYVSGLRVELAEDHILTLQSYPQFIYVDAWFDGDSNSVWKGQTAFTVTNTEMDDYIDVNGKQHYVFKLARITAADMVEDLRNVDGLVQKVGNIELKIKETISLKDFGAIGDGITDDTIAWNKWLEEDGNYIPDGSYLISGVVKKYSMPIYVSSGNDNIHASGVDCLVSNTTGYNIFASGRGCLRDNTEGFDLVAIGTQCMRKNKTGNRSTGIGIDVLAENEDGHHNLAGGQNALRAGLHNTYNTVMAIDGLQYGDNNHFNIVGGQYAGLYLNGALHNTIHGYNILSKATEGNGNCGYGSYVFSEQLAESDNSAFGTDSCRFNVDGKFISAFGYRSVRSNTSGNYLSGFGNQALFKNIDGEHNVGTGYAVLYNNESGDWNTASGDYSLYNAKGSKNTADGGYSGYSITFGDSNTFLGYGAGYHANQKIDAVNTTGIGNGAYTELDNTIQLGNTAVVGVGVGQNKMFWLASLPTEGKWARGSVVFNLGVVAGGSMGWMCVTGGDFAGTPPVFKAMPSLAA
ncbi:phage tail protein [Shewanella sp. AC91-MNA-CIBAN-0169]|uniref:phage tail-collar fiber domain-containing protein n=1 Tax=Shewanella sp. AC91-MNA-CIBAN-0169 TaxID=3140466 RepID=UPI0033317415